MKKRIVFAVCAWLLSLGQVFADELVISDVTVPQGGSAQLNIGFHFTSSTDKVGFTFSLGMPDGITIEKDNEGEPVYVKDASITKLNIICAGAGNFGGQPSNENATIKGSEGTLLTLTINAEGSLAVGSTHTVNVTKATFQEKVDGNVMDINIPDFTFIITIGDPEDSRTILDETSTIAPEAATGVDVKVLRTIKANEWSTICLPFAMTETQVKAAFGDDVELADFTGCEATYDAEDNITALTVNFSDVSAIEANHPYIIKVSEAVSEFVVDNVDITPSDNLSVDRDEDAYKRNGKWYYDYNSFIGTYVANTEIPEQALFLNDNKFWYSSGKTKSKAFRGYFSFYLILSEVANASSRISMTVIEEITSISNIIYSKDNIVFDLMGRQVDRPGKGVYVRDGRKVVVK